jgi:hypothetical protein
VTVQDKFASGSGKLWPRDVEWSFRQWALLRLLDRAAKLTAWAYRDDTARIQFAVALIVVALDVPKVDSRCDALDAEQSAHIVRKARIVGDPPDVAFEMADIDGIEADQRREQPPVGLRDRHL